MVTRTIPIIRRTCSLGTFVPARTPKPLTSAGRTPDNADFFVKTYRRIHDARTLDVNRAAGAGSAGLKTITSYDCLRRETFAPRIQAELADG